MFFVSFLAEYLKNFYQSDFACLPLVYNFSPLVLFIIIAYLGIFVKRTLYQFCDTPTLISYDFRFLSPSFNNF